MPQPVDTRQQTNYPEGVRVRNDYTLEPGVCVLPLAQDPPTAQAELANWSPVVVLRLHAPYRLRRVNYDTMKQKNPPVLPSPESTGAFVFVGGTLIFNNALDNSLSNYDWRTQADYLYVENCVSRTQDGFVLGLPPYDTATMPRNYQTYPPNSPGVGAIAEAGADARVGYTMGTTIGNYISSGAWGYNVCSFFPGNLFNDNIVNGGPDSPGQ